MTGGIFETLVRLNQEISTAEDRGDAEALGRYLAQQLAFRRANGQLVGRDDFLAEVKSGGPRETVMRSILMLGEARAFVTCDVTMAIGGKPKTFENARLFVLAENGDWQVLGWANEPARPLQVDREEAR